MFNVMKETNYCCKFIHFAHPAMSVNGPTQQLTDLGWFQTCPSKKIRYLEQFLIICRIWASIRRIDAMTKVLIKSEWWNFSVHYINLNDVQFYPLYRMAWNGTRRFNIYTTVFQQIGVFHFMISGAFLIFCCNNLCWKKTFTIPTVTYVSELSLHQLNITLGCPQKHLILTHFQFWQILQYHFISWDWIIFWK